MAETEVAPVPSLNETVDLIEKSSIETVLSAVVIIVLVTGIGIFAWWLRRKLSGDYIHKDKTLEYVKENHPEKIKPSINELSDLRDHDAFDMWDRELRYCDSLQVKDQSGKINTKYSAIAKDLIQWTIRANRNTFKKMLDEAYQLVEQDPEAFERYFGDSKGFNHKINGALTQIKAAISYKLKDELEMPELVYNSFEQYREEVQETMRDMLQIAVTNHTNNYWRMHEVLNSQYAFTRTLRLSVINFLICSGGKFDDVEYVGGKSESTMHNFTASLGTRPNPAASIFNYG